MNLMSLTLVERNIDEAIMHPNSCFLQKFGAIRLWKSLPPIILEPPNLR